MIVTLTRKKDDGIQTVGKLSTDGFSCCTLEKPWFNNASNISCIPKGTYQVKYTFSYKFLKYTYEIQNVLNRSGIRIHSGNFFFDILGCILLGDSYSFLNDDGEIDILNPKATINKFETLLNKQPFTLIIK